MDFNRTVPPVVVVIGDSFTGGSDMGGNQEANWSALLGKDLGWIDCANALGGSGWSVGAEGNTFGSRVDWAVQQDPSLIIFFNGINDLRLGPDAVYPSANSALADLKVKAPDIPVVVVGPILMRDDQKTAVLQMRDEVKAATEDNGDTFIDPVERGWFDGDKRALIGGDRFHPTDEGHVYLAEMVKDSLAAADIVVPRPPADDLHTCSPPARPETP
jgi:lysophospholipase L1-like esterase